MSTVNTAAWINELYFIEYFMVARCFLLLLSSNKIVLCPLSLIVFKFHHQSFPFHVPLDCNVLQTEFMLIIITVKIDLTKSRTILNWVFEMLSGCNGFKTRIECVVIVMCALFAIYSLTWRTISNWMSAQLQLMWHDIKKRRKYLNDVWIHT